MDETTTPLDRIVEVLVYAPIGLALTLRDDLQSVVDRGRRTVVPQVEVAKFVGRLAVAQAQRAAADLVDEAIGLIVSQPSPSAPGPLTDEPVPSGAAGNGSAGGVTASAVPEDQLAIPGYDSLSAAQVVQRLGGLGAGELDAVRQYEEAHRGRRTILCKIEQLQAGEE
ncbi:MAG TPA: hypothetical protein VMU14_04230 [Acidimicrobiales bacterium]|nr:hypothetical protein [Acidimicrobiales bacterium]